MEFNRSYPKQYESHYTLNDGSKVFLRPIVPSDAPLILDLFDRLSDNARYLRFLRHIEELPQEMLNRFTHMDYINEFALIAVIRENGRDAITAVARYALQDSKEPADLAIAVRDDRQNLGLGTIRLGKIIDIGKEHGITRYNSMMGAGNAAMKHILAALGYRVSYANGNGVYRVSIMA